MYIRYWRVRNFQVSDIPNQVYIMPTVYLTKALNRNKMSVIPHPPYQQSEYY